MTENKTLKPSLKKHYQQQQLTDTQLAELKKLQEQFETPTASNTSSPNSPQGKRRSFKYAAALALMLSIGFFSGHQLSTYHYSEQLNDLKAQSLQLKQDDKTALFRSIAEEITFNHRKLKPLEIETNQFNDLVNYFSMLDFRPHLPNQFIPEGTLIGGRYCSIGSISAVQIRYKNEENDIATLYQTAYEPSVFSGIPNIEKGEQAVTQYLNGYKVVLWLELGIVMATVSSPQ
jgi:hypothetical protein